MAQTVKLKRSATQGNIPTIAQLELGEVAINTYDGKLFVKKDNGTESILQIGGSSSIGELTDVDTLTTPPISDDYLKFDGTNWTPAAPEVLVLDDIVDVDTTSVAPVVDDGLYFNGTSWVPGTAPAPVISLDDLTDVDTTTTAPQVGDILEWDGTNWIPGVRLKSDSTGITGATTVTNIVQIGQADYDSLTPDAGTVYIINGA